MRAWLWVQLWLWVWLLNVRLFFFLPFNSHNRTAQQCPFLLTRTLPLFPSSHSFFVNKERMKAAGGEEVGRRKVTVLDLGYGRLGNHLQCNLRAMEEGMRCGALTSLLPPSLVGGGKGKKPSLKNSVSSSSSSLSFSYPRTVYDFRGLRGEIEAEGWGEEGCKEDNSKGCKGFFHLKIPPPEHQRTSLTTPQTKAQSRPHTNIVATPTETATTPMIPTPLFSRIRRSCFMTFLGIDSLCDSSLSSSPSPPPLLIHLRNGDIYEKKSAQNTSPDHIQPPFSSLFAALFHRKWREVRIISQIKTPFSPGSGVLFDILYAIHKILPFSVSFSKSEGGGGGWGGDLRERVCARFLVAPQSSLNVMLEFHPRLEGVFDSFSSSCRNLTMGGVGSGGGGGGGGGGGVGSVLGVGGPDGDIDAVETTTYIIEKGGGHSMHTNSEHELLFRPSSPFVQCPLLSSSSSSPSSSFSLSSSSTQRYLFNFSSIPEDHFHSLNTLFVQLTNPNKREKVRQVREGENGREEEEEEEEEEAENSALPFCVLLGLLLHRPWEQVYIFFPPKTFPSSFPRFHPFSPPSSFSKMSSSTSPSLILRLALEALPPSLLPPLFFLQSVPPPSLLQTSTNFATPFFPLSSSPPSSLLNLYDLSPSQHQHNEMYGEAKNVFFSKHLPLPPPFSPLKVMVSECQSSFIPVSSVRRKEGREEGGRGGEGRREKEARRGKETKKERLARKERQAKRERETEKKREAKREKDRRGRRGGRGARK